MIVEMVYFECNGCGRREEMKKSDDELPDGWAVIKHRHFSRYHLCSPGCRGKAKQAWIDKAISEADTLFGESK